MDREALARILCSPETAPDDWLDAFVTFNGLAYDYKTDSIRDQGELVEHATIIAQMRLCSYRNEVTNLRAYLADALLLWKRKQAKALVAGLRRCLSFRPTQDDHLARWVVAATGCQNPLDLAAMRHFVWQVKRKLARLPVEHHMMPVLYGKTGGGKSVAVHKLLEPVQEVTLCRDMGVFSDAFGRRQFARQFVMFFDELSKSSTVDVNALKNVITAPVVEWRVMRSEGVFSSPQNCTFIACSNDPVAERIEDPTSARRFWQVNCADRLDWDAINGLDYEALWRSVDESAACPLLPFLDDIQAIQHRDLRAKDLVEQWLETSCEPAPFHAESPTTNELFESFVEWCRWQGITAHPGVQKFSRGLESRMRALGWGIESKRTNRGTAWSLRIRGSVGTGSPVAS